MKGQKSYNSHHLQVNGRMIKDNKEKEETFKEIWENIFRITEDENLNYDVTKEREVEDYINENINQCQLYINSNISNVNQRNRLTTDRK